MGIFDQFSQSTLGRLLDTDTGPQGRSVKFLHTMCLDVAKW